MNKTYRVIFNRTLGRIEVVSEHASAKGKGGGVGAIDQRVSVKKVASFSPNIRACAYAVVAYFVTANFSYSFAAPNVAGMCFSNNGSSSSAYSGSGSGTAITNGDCTNVPNPFGVTAGAGNFFSIGIQNGADGFQAGIAVD
ncbi:ESPR domain-containing protein [Trinickia acidisoli]|uniref:ESPR domain-containing protein n=1 Tax=Trinickia acidisoli TaxID=2767482 RepID=UPI001A8F1CCE|nr:ESPR domain-containing protein [Trinickia acidisoli]